MRWLLVCDPALPVEDYGEVLSGVPSEEQRAGCPPEYRALFLEASLDQVRPLNSGDPRVCRIVPVWEERKLSPAELLVLGRRLEAAQEAEGKEGKDEEKK